MSACQALSGRARDVHRGRLCGLTPPSSGRTEGRFAPFGLPLMSNVRRAVSRSDLLERPTKEQIALLPPFIGLDLNQIVVLRSHTQLEDAYRAIEKEKFVGFDTESKPTFVKGAEATGPHVVQFALRERAFVVQLSEEPPLAFLRSVIESQSI